ncbi:MAG: hypothetical protein K940chlam1_00729 [Candidatus Anoxychlamydiales bacterium]|nr:hypothetical protein [Candidatus Anoxychlamydiales bacterium]NGX36521.1 hypothetical protein [Candidatus Anoxychlamydiales bacterium]
MTARTNFYVLRTYSQLAIEFDTLAKITPKNLEAGYELSVGKDNYLSFVKPWGFQKAGAWAKSANLGYSEKDERIVAYLNKWFKDLLVDGVVNSDSVKTIGWKELEVKSFEKAFKGLVTLAESYIKAFAPRKDQGPYYAKKMETAKTILDIARNYRLNWLDKKVDLLVDTEEVDAQTQKWFALMEENFPKQEAK